MCENEEDWPNKRKTRREESYTREVKRDKSSKGGMVNGIPFAELKYMRNGNIHAT